MASQYLKIRVKMPTDTMNNGSYAGILTANAGLENRLGLQQYNSLDGMTTQMQYVDVEDPPETMHMPWGVWRHWRDALHSIDERLDAEHLIRKGRAAEDILHHAHYVPVIGEEEDEEKAYEINIEYNDPVQLEVYNSKINLKYSPEIDFEEGIKDENTKISINTEIEDDSIDVESTIEENPEEQSPDESQKKDFNLEFEKELTKIFENILKYNYTHSHK